MRRTGKGPLCQPTTSVFFFTSFKGCILFVITPCCTVSQRIETCHKSILSCIILVLDECSDSTLNACDASTNATCEDLDSGYKCNCPIGYIISDNQYTCESKYTQRYVPSRVHMYPVEYISYSLCTYTVVCSATQCCDAKQCLVSVENANGNRFKFIQSNHNPLKHEDDYFV